MENKIFKKEIIRGHKISYRVNGKDLYPEIYIKFLHEDKYVRGFHVKNAFKDYNGNFICYGIHTKIGVLKLSEKQHKQFLRLHGIAKKIYKENEERERRDFYIKKSKESNKIITEMVGISPSINKDGFQDGEYYHYVRATPKGEFKIFKKFMG